MDRKLAIGLIYHVDDNWIAGSYYIENLVHALGNLPAEDQPFLKIYCTSATEGSKLLEKTGYTLGRSEPLQAVTGLVARIVNAITYRLVGSHWILGNTDTDVDVGFPNPSSFQFNKIPVKLFWIPDFQEIHYPMFFSPEQLSDRKARHDQLVRDKHPIVFSSEHAKRDFLTLYPGAENRLFVMPFAVTLPDLGGIQSEDLRKKYDLPERYFICSNQFWAHKNHLVVLQALKLLRDEGHPQVVAFTGQPFDNRSPTYYPSLLEQVKREGTSEFVRFLGFLPRHEQLLLMRDATATIQPSLFEGWSTVVEDAKALGRPILVSDIPVHREQLPHHESFFAPHDQQALANLMKSIKGSSPVSPPSSYSKSVNAFGKTFVEIINSIVR